MTENIGNKTRFVEIVGRKGTQFGLVLAAANEFAQKNEVIQFQIEKNTIFLMYKPNEQFYPGTILVEGGTMTTHDHIYDMTKKEGKLEP